MKAENNKSEIIGKKGLPGLTWRSFVAIIYSCIVFQPAAIYIWLVSHNSALFACVSWATLILFVELTRLYGKPLSRQEAAIIFIGSGISTGTAMFFQERIAAAYFRHSPTFSFFGIAEKVPAWYAPPLHSEAWYMRTFMHPDFFLPLVVPLIQFVFSTFVAISLGILGYQIFVVSEKLPFPVQSAAVSSILTLTERDSERMKILILSALVSMFYTVFLYTIPFIGQTQGYNIQIIPVPWADFNQILHKTFRGASLGIATDIAILATGLLIPFNAVISLFIGSFTLYFVGNLILVNLGLTQFASEWAYGMSTALSYERSLLYSWSSPIVGISVAAGILPLITRPTLLKGLFKFSGSVRGGISFLIVMTMFLVGTFGSIIMTHLLIPDFPVWILVLLSVGWSLINLFVSTRAMGIAGISFDVPAYPDQDPSKMVFAISGYTGVDIYFYHKTLVVDTSSGGPSWTANFKILDLCETPIKSYIMVYLISLPIALCTSFIFMQNFWRIAPIPSARYPGVYIYWPVVASFRALWASGALKIFDVNSMLYGFLTTSAIYLLVEGLHLPFSVISAVAGLTTPIPIAVTMLIGAFIGKFISIYRGRDWWNKYRAVIAGGILLGEGIMVVTGAAVAIILAGVWFQPY